MKRLLASLSVFALLLGLVPLHPVAAAHADFRLQNFSTATSASFSSLTGGMGVNADDVSQWSAGSDWSIVSSPVAGMSNKVARLTGPSDSTSGVLQFTSNPWLEDMTLSFKYAVLPGAVFVSGDTATVEWSNDRGNTWTVWHQWDLGTLQPAPSGVHTITSPVLPDELEYRNVQFRATVVLANVDTSIVIDDVRFDGTEKNMIEGGVYEDVNGNGTYDGGVEVWQNNRTVQLYAIDGLGGRTLLDSMLTGAADSNTNSVYASHYVGSGQYRFLNVPDGKYQVCEIIDDSAPGLDWNQTSPKQDFLDPFLDPDRNVADVEAVVDQSNSGQYCYELTLNEGANRGQQHALRFGNQSFPDPDATLTIEKVIVDSGAEVGDFQYTLTVNGNDQALSAFEEGGTDIVLTAGDTYEVVEAGHEDFDAVLSSGCAGTITGGTDVVCTITNTHIPDAGTITIVKELIRDHGTPDTESDFDLMLTDVQAQVDATRHVLSGVAQTVDPGTYTVSEAWFADHEVEYPGAVLSDWYTQTIVCTSDAQQGTLSLPFTVADDEHVTCTITNDDKPATITFTKLINGGPTVSASSFSFAIDGTDVSIVNGNTLMGPSSDSIVFTGNATGTQITLDAGMFTLDEVAATNYLLLLNNPDCAGVTLTPGQHLDCTATNSYTGPSAYLQGFFYKDLNSNGTWDGAPDGGSTSRLNDLDVSLYNSAGVKIDSMLTGRANTNTTTTYASGPVSKGQYRFRYLPAGVYYVCAPDLTATYDQTSPQLNFKDPVLAGAARVSSVADTYAPVNDQYCYRVELRTNEHRTRLRLGFEDAPIVNPNPTRELMGSKFNDGDSDGGWGKDEDGLADWSMYLVKQVATAQVNGNAEDAVNGTFSFTFEDGKQYIVRASGTFEAGDNITADAKYSVRSPNTDWTDFVQNYEIFGTGLLDLKLDGVMQNWGPYNADHVYFTTIEGDGELSTFEVEDIFPSNNTGLLQLEVYEVLDTTVTDENGDYSFDVTGLTGELGVIEDTHVSGWEQTLPAGEMHMYSVAESEDDAFDLNFGNHQFGRGISESIVPTLSCIEPTEGEDMYRAHFGYVNNNADIAFIAAGSNDNRLLGGGLSGSNQGQPSNFQVGEQTDVFTVDFNRSIPLTWTIETYDDENSITADQNSVLCNQEPVDPATITLHKILYTDNGAPETVDDFVFMIDGSPVQLDEPIVVTPNVAHAISEAYVQPPTEGEVVADRYMITFDEACSGGTFTLADGQDLVCTITNDDLSDVIYPGTLMATLMINNGSAVAEDFEIFMSGSSEEYTSGTTLDPFNGAYTVNVTLTPADYTLVFSDDCVLTGGTSADGYVSSDEDATCTITATYSPNQTSGGSGNGGGGGGGGSGSRRAPTNNNDVTNNQENEEDGNNGSGDVLGQSDEQPEGIVLGESDEQDPGATTEGGNGGGGVIAPLPTPIIAGVNDELPRTGLPIGGLLALGSVLGLVFKRRED